MPRLQNQSSSENKSEIGAWNNTYRQPDPSWHLSTPVGRAEAKGWLSLRREGEDAMVQGDSHETGCCVLERYGRIFSTKRVQSKVVVEPGGVGSVLDAVRFLECEV